MNQTFSFPRFAQLNRWFWATNGRTYSLGLLALFIFTTLLLGRVLLINGYDQGTVRNNVPYFIILSFITVSLLSIHLVSILHDQNSALLYLMLPASRTEKFMVAVLYFVVFIAGYSLFYMALEALFLQIANSRLPATGNHYYSEILHKPGERVKDIASMSYALLLVAVLGLLSSLFFRQSVFVKNTVLLFCLFVGPSLVYNYVVSAYFPGLEAHVSSFFLMGDLYVSPKGQYSGATRLPAPDFIKYIFPWLLLGALWLTARIRFNEIER